MFDIFLDCADDEMRHNDENKESIKKAIQYLSYNYSPRRPKSERDVDMDFDQVDLRSAYLYTYSTSICYMVQDVLQKGSDVVRNLIQRVVEDQETLNVTSLGGGPGAGLAGVLLYLDESFKGEDLKSVKVNAVEKYGGWQSVFSRLMTEIKNKRLSASSTLSSEHEFLRQDFLKPLSDEVRDVLQQTDMLIMVKFFSTVDAVKKKTAKSLEEVLGHLRKGTLVVLIDNSGGTSFKNAHETCKLQNFRDVINSIRTSTGVRNYDFKIPPTMEPNMRKIYDRDPQTEGGIAYAILEKEFD